MKKFLAITAALILGSFLIAGPAMAAPTTTFFGNIAPTTNNTYSLSTSALKWAKGFFQQASTTDLTVGGKVYDGSNSSGTAGFTLESLGTTVKWVATTTLATISGTLNLTSQVTGVLPVANGGTNISSPTAAGVVLGNYAGTGYMQLATSTLGLLTTNVAEGSNQYFTNARAIASVLTGYVSGAGTISATDSILSAIQKLNGNIVALVTGVSSVSNSDSSITATPTTGAVVVSLNTAHSNVFSVLQTFSNSTTTALSATYASSTVAFFGTLNLPNVANGILKATSGVVGHAVGDTDYQNPITLTTTGTSGVSTFTGDTLNIPNYANTTYTAAWPVTLTGTVFGFNGLSTTTNLTQGFLPYVTGVNTFGQVATTSVTCSGIVTCSSFTAIGASPITINATGGGSGTVTSITLGGGLDGASPITTTGTITAQVGTSTVPALGGLAYWTGIGTPSTLGTVATGTISNGTGISVTGGQSVIGSGLTITNTSPLSGLVASFPFSFSNPTLTWLGLSTSTPGITAGQPIYATGVNTIASVASSTFLTSIGGQVAGNYITALTGDVTATGPGSVAATLATVNTNTGSWGSSTAIPNFTVNGKGLITAAGTNVVIAPAGTLSGTTLNSTVVSSSLTSVGTLSALTISGNLTLSALTGTQCLQEISGVVSGTGSACGSGGGTTYTGTYPIVVTGSVISTPLATTTIQQTYGTAQIGAITLATTSASFNGLTVADAITNSGGTFTISPLWSGTLNNTGLTNSTISGVALGSNLNTLTFGTHLTGTSYNGSSAVTLGTDATNANTVSTIVARDGSGNFAAGTGTFTNLIDTGVTANTLAYSNASQQLTAVTLGTGLSLTTGTLTNTGVTSIVAGTNITISGSTGAVTINSTGGGSSFAYPFTPSTDGGINTSATTTPIEGSASGLAMDVSQFGWYGQGGALLAYASSTNRDTIFGLSAGNNATTTATLAQNTAIGFKALNANTGTGNTSIGAGSLQTLTTGINNVAIGVATLNILPTGSGNVAVGQLALSNLQGTSISNVAIGLAADAGQTSGSQNIAIGQNVNEAVTSGSAQLNIGNVIYGTSLYTGTSGSSVPTVAGRIGIGTTTPLGRFSIAANSGDTNTNLFVIGSTTAAAVTSTLFQVLNTGQVFAPKLTTSAAAQAGTACVSSTGELINESAVCASSARRYKQDITDFSTATALSQILALDPVTYYFKPDFNGALQSNPNYSRIQVGLIADDVIKVNPAFGVVETATTTFEGKVYAPGTPASVDYNQITAALIGAVKSIVSDQNSQEQQIQELQAEVISLQGERNICAIN